MIFLDDFFDNNIPDKIYRKLNKDKGVNYHFRSDNVGQCAKMFDDFRRNHSFRYTKKEWEKYYFSMQPKEPLIIAADYIKQKYKIDLIIAKKYVHFRIIGQTWNGMINEERVVRELEKRFSNLYFKKTPYELDQDYFTDWEGYNRNTLIIGIQVKPLSYSKMNTPYQIKAKENHQKQADRYKAEFKVPHIIIYYDNNELHEPELTCDKIDTLLYFFSKKLYK